MKVRAEGVSVIDREVIAELDRAAARVEVDGPSHAERRATSIAIAAATRVRSCACSDVLDVREDDSRLECGACGALILTRRAR